MTVTGGHVLKYVVIPVIWHHWAENVTSIQINKPHWSSKALVFLETGTSHRRVDPNPPTACTQGGFGSSRSSTQDRNRKELTNRNPKDDLGLFSNQRETPRESIAVWQWNTLSTPREMSPKTRLNNDRDTIWSKIRHQVKYLCAALAMVTSRRAFPVPYL